jgi:SAM-dependent methyltransferase
VGDRLNRSGGLLAALAWARSLIPKPWRLGIVRATRWPPIGKVDLGGLRRLTPISRSWGGDRGLPVDRYYIEQFLERWSDDVHGRVLEIGDNEYTLRFGGARVQRSEILHAALGNPKATYVDDLTKGETIPSATFDCIICTQTLHVIPDMSAAVRTLHRLLKPGGVLLATFPGISQIYRDRDGRWGDFWRVTDRSAAWLLTRVFPPADVTIETRGNVLSAIAFLQGLSAGELDSDELDFTDEDYQVSIGARAVRSVR